MRDWIVIAVLYTLFLAFFRFLGGLGAAGDALRRWGKASASIRINPGSSS
jgi:hypothetical protein